MVGDVVHQISHVDWERETVMVLLMVVGLMGIGDVGGVLYVAAIIVKNLAITSMKKTIVVMWNRLLPQRDHLQVMFLVFLLNHHKVGLLSLVLGQQFSNLYFQGQRCSGRNYNGRRCCTPQNPCGEGEGDCDGAGDGGQNDGNRGCRGNLVCGSNNCKQFGLYFHDKDDCCERPSGGFGDSQNTQQWGSWGAWSRCDRSCGVGKKSRVRYCTGSQCTHSQENQERVCLIRQCWG